MEEENPPLEIKQKAYAVLLALQSNFNLDDLREILSGFRHWKAYRSLYGASLVIFSNEPLDADEIMDILEANGLRVLDCDMAAVSFNDKQPRLLRNLCADDDDANAEE